MVVAAPVRSARARARVAPGVQGARLPGCLQRNAAPDVDAGARPRDAARDRPHHLRADLALRADGAAESPARLDVAHRRQRAVARRLLSRRRGVLRRRSWRRRGAGADRRRAAALCRLLDRTRRVRAAMTQLTRAASVVAAVALLAGGCRASEPAAPPQAVVVWKPIGSWSGRGDKQTETFTSDSGGFRVHWAMKNETRAGAGRLRVVFRSGDSGREIIEAI